MTPYEKKTLPAITVIGMQGQGPAGTGNSWIAPLWQAANERFGEIAPLVLTDDSGAPKRLWGAMSDVTHAYHPWGEEGLYLAGAEANADAQAPEGWTKWTLPAHTYMVVMCSQNTYQRVFSAMLDDVLPRLGYTLTGAVHEVYYPSKPGCLYLYFPID